MEYLPLCGILSFITGIALLFHTIRKRKSIGLILYVTYLIGCPVRCTNFSSLS